MGVGNTNDRLRPNGHERNPCQVLYMKLILFIFSSHNDNIFHERWRQVALDKWIDAPVALIQHARVASSKFLGSVHSQTRPSAPCMVWLYVA